MPTDAANSEIAVFISNRDSTCSECGNQLGKRAWIRLIEGKGAVCLACADLDHLAFLPSGDMALTRRAKKYSKLTAVVLHWSSSRKRYERQGLLVEGTAIEQAEKECLADGPQRERKRLRDQERRAIHDQKFVEGFAKRIEELYPGAPKGRAAIIAARACDKYSGRVGRSASARDLEAEAVKLAVVAHIRHEETDYDDLLMKGRDRHDARAIVSDRVFETLEAWRRS
jgi:hypothetical protein